jgi:hypothetical protein
MVNALGKRPFDAADDMDKYLDEEVSIYVTCRTETPQPLIFHDQPFQAKRKAGEASAPPPLEGTPDLPSPSVASSGGSRDQD